jgi:ABC-type branched-subunit amino acid transport system substrate-binding protein/predicted Ser/Thr protein kinase
MSELVPGTVVHRRYRIGRVLARGGMGVLYEAFDEQLERTVAVKQNGNLLAADLFLTEAKLLGRLQHANLPAAIDIFEENGQQFFVMEYIEGINLDQVLTERQRCSVNEAGPWMLQILDALDYLHTREPPVIHRDIKPSNLILSGGKIFLVDFGISKDTKQTRLSGSGTLQYASPEHAVGPTTAQSDLYSFSATFYHLLTGRPVPFADTRIQETCRKGRGDPLLPATICEPSVGQAFSDILTRGLCLDAQDRYRSAAEMRRAVEQALQTVAQLDAPAQSDTRTLTAQRWRQMQARAGDAGAGEPMWRRWQLWALAATALAGVVLVSALAGALGAAGAATGTPSAGTAVAEVPPEPTAAATEAPAATEPPAATEAPAAPTPEPATPPPAAIVAPAPLPPAAPDTIRIALQSPQSGEWGNLGTGIRNGAELAIKEQSKALNDLGYRVEFAPFDDRGNPEQGKANAEVIVADPAVLCVVGHFNSGATLMAQPLYGPAQLVQISPGSTNPQVTDGNDTVWRVVGRDDVQGDVAAQFARKALNSQRAFVIHDGTAYGRGISAVFRDRAGASGITIVGITSYDDTQAEVDFAPLLAEIKALPPEQQPDVIYFAGSYTRAGVFFKLAREQGVAAQFLGSDSLDNGDLVKLAGEAVGGMHFTTVAAPVREFPKARQFAAQYQATYGQEAPPFSPESYDAATLCIRAIANAASANGGRLPTREQVMSAMRTMPRFEGISGNYLFNANGDPQSVGYFVVQVNIANWAENRVVETLLARPPQ